MANTQGNSLCSFAVGWATVEVSQADKSILQLGSMQQPEAEKAWVGTKKYVVGENVVGYLDFSITIIKN